MQLLYQVRMKHFLKNRFNTTKSGKKGQKGLIAHTGVPKRIKNKVQKKKLIMKPHN